MRPARGATFTASGSFSAGIFQSTRPVRGATRLQRGEITGDQAFQSTRPVRGATPHFRFHDLRHIFQSTRPMRGATRMMLAERGVFSFQSTRPMRGATVGNDLFGMTADSISIHAPRAGRDNVAHGDEPPQRNFNPRAPCGARPAVSLEGIPLSVFQSTRPVRGATPDPKGRLQAVPISIHAPRAGRDATLPLIRSRRSYFNPRAPCGARPGSEPAVCGQGGISIHAPRAGRDTGEVLMASEYEEFQSTRPVRGATTCPGGLSG